MGILGGDLLYPCTVTSAPCALVQRTIWTVATAVLKTVGDGRHTTFNTTSESLPELQGAVESEGAGDVEVQRDGEVGQCRTLWSLRMRI
jgi:hypothetical protein